MQKQGVYKQELIFPYQPNTVDPKIVKLTPLT